MLQKVICMFENCLPTTLFLFIFLFELKRRGTFKLSVKKDKKLNKEKIS